MAETTCVEKLGTRTERERAGQRGRKRRGSAGAADASEPRCPAPHQRSQRSDQLLNALVTSLEGVLAEHRALGLVVQLQVHPVDRVVALALLGLADELTAQTRPRRLGRIDHRL